MNHLQANLCLLCVTFCWSTEVIIFACIPNTVTPFATTCITFLIGGALLIMAFFKRILSGLRTDFKRQMIRCLFLCVLNGTYNTMYQFGLKSFDVSSGAFTLCLTVVALPVILIVQRSKVERKTWLSALIVLAGICIALSGLLTRDQLPGLIIIAIGCLLRAFYIIKLNQYARDHDPLVISTLICIFGGIISFVFWMGVQPSLFLGISWSPVIIASLVIYGYFVVALTISLNTFAQRRTTPTNATIIYSLEIVFSILWGAVLPDQLITPVQLTPKTVCGVLCVVIGNLVVLFDFNKIRDLRKEASV